MGCCGGKRTRTRRRTRSPSTRPKYDLRNSNGTFNAARVRARLETYKKRYCQECEKRYECDYKMYEQCQKYKIDGGK